MEKDNLARQLGRLYQTLTKDERRGLDFLERHFLIRRIIPIIGFYLPCFQCYSYASDTSLVPKWRYQAAAKQIPFMVDDGGALLNFVGVNPIIKWTRTMFVVFCLKIFDVPPMTEPTFVKVLSRYPFVNGIVDSFMP